jgi:pyruvate-formate lyase-activating enzyme
VTAAGPAAAPGPAPRDGDRDGDGVFHRTRSHCCACGVLHDAAFREVNGAVVLEVYCPRGTGTAPVSSDARVFRLLRARSTLGEPPLPQARATSWINVLEITRDCNLACPICFAAAHPGAGGYLSVDEVARRVRRLRAQGGQAVSLSGGEPTLHPDLLAIVRAARRARVDVTLLTNGLRLAEDPSLARRLARSGLTYVYVQLDTLRDEVCARIRGDRGVDRRLAALRRVAEAGQRCGVNVTVVRDNLPEVGEVLRRAVGHAPALGVVAFLAAGRSGRFLLPPEASVSREDILGALVDSGVVEGLAPEHFWPFPRFAPVGLDVHPDCGALLLLALDRGVLRPLDDYLDVGALFRRMRGARGPVSRLWAFLLVNLYLWRSVRLRRLPALGRMLLGMLTKRGRSSFVAVSVEQFLDREHQDEERLERCTSCPVQGDGERISMCLFQHPDPRRAPRTRVNGG